MPPKKTSPATTPVRAPTTIKDLDNDSLMKIRLLVSAQKDRNAGTEAGVFQRRTRAPLQVALAQLDESRKSLADSISEVTSLSTGLGLNNYMSSLKLDVQTIKNSTKNIHATIMTVNRLHHTLKNASPEVRGHHWLKFIASTHFQNFGDLNAFESIHSFMVAIDGPLDEGVRSHHHSYKSIGNDAYKEWNKMVNAFGPARLSATDRAKFITMLTLYAVEDTDHHPYYSVPSQAEKDEIVAMAEVIDNTQHGGKRPQSRKRTGGVTKAQAQK